MSRVAADAGYDSEENHRLAREDLMTRTAISPTRGRRSANLPTGRYRRLMKQRFPQRIYHQRWQVETVFNSMKCRQKSAVHVWSYWAKCRDLWLGVLTHNVMLKRRA